MPAVFIATQLKVSIDFATREVTIPLFFPLRWQCRTNLLVEDEVFGFASNKKVRVFFIAVDLSIK